MSNKENSVIHVEHVIKIFNNNKTSQKLYAAKKNKDDIYKATGANVALDDVSFDVKKGELFCIIGLSGSGKSTIIRCLNALLKPTKGKIEVNGINLSSLSKKELIEFRRNQISMVFQNFGLMSHRNVLDNITYGLEIKGISKQQRNEKALEMIEMVGLSGYENEKIINLSGGMKQRVGIARALSSETEILLMDEPFSALDPLVRKEMQFELLKIQKNLNKTIVFITHDIDEAFKLGDRIAIMQDGKIIQIDTPEEMSINPKNDYVKEFIDSTNKIKIFDVQHVMIPPTCMTKLSDSPTIALREMKNSHVSTAYVIDSTMELQGIITLEDLLYARKNNLSIKEIIKPVITVSTNASISDILNSILESPYPLAAIDAKKHLQGIVTKASVLSLVK